MIEVRKLNAPCIHHPAHAEYVKQDIKDIREDKQELKQGKADLRNDKRTLN